MVVKRLRQLPNVPTERRTCYLIPLGSPVVLQIESIQTLDEVGTPINFNRFFPTMFHMNDRKCKQGLELPRSCP